MKSILVTGASGSLGTRVIHILTANGRKVNVLTRKKDRHWPAGVTAHIGDLVSGAGLDAASHGVSTIIHCASNSGDTQNTDVSGTDNLLKAIPHSKVHLVYISIVGVDSTEFPYYRAKLQVENNIIRSGQEHTILRATQFHDFVLKLLLNNSRKEGTVWTIPEGLRFQSVDIGEVAAKLADCCDAPPAGLLPNFAGPQMLPLEQMAAEYREATGIPGTIETVATSDPRHALFRSGINLSKDGEFGKITWRAFLDGLGLGNRTASSSTVV